MLAVKQERDTLRQMFTEVKNASRTEHDAMTQERNVIERQFFDYKTKSLAGTIILENLDIAVGICVITEP